MLLGVYLWADLASSLHSYFAYQEQTETVCTPENEKDSCHRTVYHHDAANGCSHSLHLIEPVVKCDLCSILFSEHIVPTKCDLKGITIAHVPTIPVLKEQLITNPTCAAHSLRGPPQFS